MKRVMFLALFIVAYAGFASGVKPFTTSAYVFVAIPALGVFVVFSMLGGLTSRRDDVHAYYLDRSDHASVATTRVWLLLLALAVALEVLGLALGGRNKAVPTLSTELDHLLVTREGRWLLYAMWLGVGIAPLLRLWRRQHTAQI